MTTAIKVEDLSKAYQIGQIGTGTISRDIERWFVTKVLKKEDPFLKIGETNDRTRKSESNVVWSLKDINLEIEQGDAVGIIGRNGAGKSTLLKLLSRVTGPTTGSIKLKGRVASLLEVGTGFHPELTGRENIYLNGSILGMRKREIDRKLDEIVDFSGVERYIDTPVKRYSSGMSVRLAFAVAAHLESEILIVDEVLAVGDAEFQKKCLGKMEDVHNAEGRTVLFVSHNLAAVSQLCRNGIWIDRGNITMAGQIEDVIHRYLLDDTTSVWERSWSWPGDAPGDEWVRLLEARVLQNGQVTGVVDINQDCEVEMTFEVLKSCRNLIAGFNFFNSQATCLFANCDWRPNQLTPGIYTKRLHVQSPLLAEGGVSVLIQLGFYDPLVRSLVLPDALSFDTVDSPSKIAVRGNYTGSWPGVLRPGLTWSDVKKDQSMYVTDNSRIQSPEKIY